MVKNKKVFLKKRNMVIVISIFVALFITIILFIASHSTYYKYNDWWIIGKTYDEVKEKYGEFDIESGNSKGYYIGDDNAIIMPTHQPQYYWMEVDENGIITKVYVATCYGG